MQAGALRTKMFCGVFGLIRARSDLLFRQQFLFVINRGSRSAGHDAHLMYLRRKKFCWEARVPAATAESVNENKFEGLKRWWTSMSSPMRRNCGYERKSKFYCPFIRTPLAALPGTDV